MNPQTIDTLLAARELLSLRASIKAESDLRAAYYAAQQAEVDSRLNDLASGMPETVAADLASLVP